MIERLIKQMKKMHDEQQDDEVMKVLEQLWIAYATSSKVQDELRKANRSGFSIAFWCSCFQSDETATKLDELFDELPEHQAMKMHLVMMDGDLASFINLLEQPQAEGTDKALINGFLCACRKGSSNIVAACLENEILHKCHNLNDDRRELIYREGFQQALANGHTQLAKMLLPKQQEDHVVETIAPIANEVAHHTHSIQWMVDNLHIHSEDMLLFTLFEAACLQRQAAVARTLHGLGGGIAHLNEQGRLSFLHHVARSRPTPDVIEVLHNLEFKPVTAEEWIRCVNRNHERKACAFISLCQSDAVEAITYLNNKFNMIAELQKTLSALDIISRVSCCGALGAVTYILSQMPAPQLSQDDWMTIVSKVLASNKPKSLPLLLQELQVVSKQYVMRRFASLFAFWRQNDNILPAFKKMVELLGLRREELLEHGIVELAIANAERHLISWLFSFCHLGEESEATHVKWLLQASKEDRLTFVKTMFKLLEPGQHMLLSLMKAFRAQQVPDTKAKLFLVSKVVTPSAAPAGGNDVVNAASNIRKKHSIKRTLAPVLGVITEHIESPCPSRNMSDHLLQRMTIRPQIPTVSELNLSAMSNSGSSLAAMARCGSSSGSISRKVEVDFEARPRRESRLSCESVRSDFQTLNDVSPNEWGSVLQTVELKKQVYSTRCTSASDSFGALVPVVQVEHHDGNILHVFTV